MLLKKRSKRKKSNALVKNSESESGNISVDVTDTLDSISEAK